MGYPRKIWAPILALALPLVGCIEQRQATIPVVAPAIRPAAAAPQGPGIIRKTVVAGETAHLTFVTSLNPDCSSRGTPVVRISEQATHGTVAIAPREDFPNFPAVNPRSACNRTKVAGVSADYTPAAGFTGSDLLTLDVIFTNGGERTAQYLITVK